MVYCGLKADARTIYHAQLCIARSRDLLHWEKLGPVRGDINSWYNKDGVLFPEPVDGMHFFLHRPWWNGLQHSDYAMRIARSAAPDGEWEDLGEMLHSFGTRSSPTRGSARFGPNSRRRPAVRHDLPHGEQPG